MEKLVPMAFAAEMKALNLNYAFMEWREKVIYPYFTGEYYENDFTFEDNSTGGEILVEGWTRGTWGELLDICEKIKKHFANYSTVIDDTAISITYLNAAPIRTGDIELKKIQIRLSTKTWKGTTENVT